MADDSSIRSLSFSISETNDVIKNSTTNITVLSKENILPYSFKDVLINVKAPLIISAC